MADECQSTDSTSDCLFGEAAESRKKRKNNPSNPGEMADASVGSLEGSVKSADDDMASTSSSCPTTQSSDFGLMTGGVSAARVGCGTLGLLEVKEESRSSSEAGNSTTGCLSVSPSTYLLPNDSWTGDSQQCSTLEDIQASCKTESPDHDFSDDATVGRSYLPGNGWDASQGSNHWPAASSGLARPEGGTEGSSEEQVFFCFPQRWNGEAENQQSLQNEMVSTRESSMSPLHGTRDSADRWWNGDTPTDCGVTEKANGDCERKGEYKSRLNDASHPPFNEILPHHCVSDGAMTSSTSCGSNDNIAGWGETVNVVQEAFPTLVSSSISSTNDRRCLSGSYLDCRGASPMSGLSGGGKPCSISPDNTLFNEAGVINPLAAERMACCDLSSIVEEKSYGGRRVSLGNESAFGDEALLDSPLHQRLQRSNTCLLVADDPVIMGSPNLRSPAHRHIPCIPSRLHVSPSDTMRITPVTSCAQVGEGQEWQLEARVQQLEVGGVRESGRHLLPRPLISEHEICLVTKSPRMLTHYVDSNCNDIAGGNGLLTSPRSWSSIGDSTGLGSFELSCASSASSGAVEGLGDDDLHLGDIQSMTDSLRFRNDESCLGSSPLLWKASEWRGDKAPLLLTSPRAIEASVTQRPCGGGGACTNRRMPHGGRRSTFLVDVDRRGVSRTGLSPNLLCQTTTSPHASPFQPSQPEPLVVSSILASGTSSAGGWIQRANNGSSTEHVEEPSSTRAGARVEPKSSYHGGHPSISGAVSDECGREVTPSSCVTGGRMAYSPTTMVLPDGGAGCGVGLIRAGPNSPLLLNTSSLLQPNINRQVAEVSVAGERQPGAGVTESSFACGTGMAGGSFGNLHGDKVPWLDVRISISSAPNNVPLSSAQPSMPHCSTATLDGGEIKSFTLPDGKESRKNISSFGEGRSGTALNQAENGGASMHMNRASKRCKKPPAALSFTALPCSSNGLAFGMLSTSGDSERVSQSMGDVVRSQECEEGGVGAAVPSRLFPLESGCGLSAPEDLKEEKHVPQLRVIRVVSPDHSGEIAGASVAQAMMSDSASCPTASSPLRPQQTGCLSPSATFLRPLGAASRGYDQPLGMGPLSSHSSPSPRSPLSGLDPLGFGLSL